VHLKVGEVFEPLWAPATYKGAYGGRGSGKSHNFAQMAVVSCLETLGTRGLCVREVQKDLKDSAKRLIEDKIEAMGLASKFASTRPEIRTPGGGLISFIGMQDHTAESVMSYEGLDWVWVEQAETLSARSLQALRPTLRKDTSELWFSWNPRRKSDPVDHFFRGEHPMDGAVLVRANWSDNPFFPAKLEKDRRHDLEFSPSYRHVWEGDYATVVEGTYFANQLAAARTEGRITELAYDPILERRAYWDLGYNDATTIWIAQFKGQRVYVMDYIEGSGQELGYYVNELRRRGHGDAFCFIPHDGAHHHVGKSVDDHLKEAGFRTKVVPNQGRGAAMLRVEAGRRVFPRIWFNTPACDAGVEALGAYHERLDEKRSVGLGPEHDWASDASDSFLMMCQLYEEPRATIKPAEREIYRAGDDAGTAWLAG
jgi:phage terminase large subunit